MRRNERRMCLAFRGVKVLPQEITNVHAAACKELDLSHNAFSSIKFLRHFINLEILILDHNQVNCKAVFPRLEKLHTLWINSNKIENLILFVDKLVASFPNLRALSMLYNESCPNFLNGGTLQKYKDYRLYLISKLKNLDMLDDKRVTDEERKEATQAYGQISVESLYDKRVKKHKKKAKKAKKKKEEIKQLAPKVQLGQTEEVMPRLKKVCLSFFRFIITFQYSIFFRRRMKKNLQSGTIQMKRIGIIEKKF